METTPCEVADGGGSTTRPPRSLSLLIVLANLVLGGVLLAGVGWLGLHVTRVLLMFTLGGFLAYALHPLVERSIRLTGGRLPRAAAIFVVLTGLGLILGAGITAAVRPTTRQVRELQVKLPHYRDRGRTLTTQLDAWMASRHLPFSVRDGVDRLGEEVRARSRPLLAEGARALERFAAGVFDLALVLIIAIYLLVYSRELRRRVVSRVPPRYQPYLTAFQRDLDQALGGFIRGQIVLALLYGVTASVIVALLGLPFPLLIGIFVALMSFIPIVGPYIGTVPAALLAALDSPWKLASLLLLFLVMNEAGSKVLYPRLVGHATGLHEVVVLFVLLAGAEMGGIWGALLAVPVTSFLGLVALYGVRLWREGALMSGSLLDPTRSSGLVEVSRDRVQPHEGEDVANPSRTVHSPEISS